MKKGWVSWVLPERERARLLEMIPPVYPDVIAHHITHAFGVSEDYDLPTETTGTIIGVADDGAGVQALVVDMGRDRPDGGTYHVTWSLDREAGRSPKQSNDVIAQGFEKIYPVRIEGLTAHFTPFGQRW